MDNRKVTKTLASGSEVEEIFLSVINEEVIRQNTEQANKRKGSVFSPSMIGDLYPCDAKLYFSYLGAPKDPITDPALIRKMQNGTKVHERVENYLHHKFGDRFQSEVRLSIPEYDIFGTCDGLLNIEEGNPFGLPADYYTVEIKSINDGGYKRLRRPSGYHQVQLTCYMTAAQASKGLFIYENKNDQEMRFFIVPYTPSIWQNIMDIIDGIRNSLQEGSTPARNEGFHCKQCIHRTVCKEEKHNG